MTDSDIDSRVIATITEYFKDSHWLRGYVRGKLRTDPAYRAVLEELRQSPQPVLDIGCGLGLLSFYLREHGVSVPILGVDCDAPKIAKATAIAEANYSGLDFAVQDAKDVSPDYSAVVILDVLHYLASDHQRNLLENIAEKVPAGGVVILRNAVKEKNLRYRLTYLEELFVRTVGWIKSRAPINFPTKDQVAQPFRARGFTEDIRPLWGNTPFNSTLFVFRRPE